MTMSDLNTMSRYSGGGGYQSEENVERFRQARRSGKFISMIILMALSLIPSFIMLGGFKLVIYMAMISETDDSNYVVKDWTLTIFGMIGAFVIYFGRNFFAWLARDSVINAEFLLRFALLIQYVMLLLMYIFKDGSGDRRFTLACALYLVSSFVYGSIISLMPMLCSQVFGPSQHTYFTLPLQEQ